MKHFSSTYRWLLLAAFAGVSLAARAQNVGIGTTAPDASAALDIVSTTKGALLPRVADATAIASPATGLIVFQTGGTAGYYYNAGTPAAPSWQQIATASGAALTASNGLTKTGQNVALGGALTANTDLPLAGKSLTFSGTGNVGVGTSSPASTLDVQGTFNVSATGPTAGAVGYENRQYAAGSGSVGQTFTLTAGSVITNVSVGKYQGTNTTQFHLYAGVGNGGIEVINQAVTVNGIFSSSPATDPRITLITPFTIPTTGQYTLWLDSFDDYYMGTGGTSAGPTFFRGSNTAGSSPVLRFNFQVNYTAPAASSLYAGGGGVGIGTNTPGYKLDVAGVVNSSTGGFRFPDGTTQTTAATPATGTSFIRVVATNYQ